MQQPGNWTITHLSHQKTNTKTFVPLRHMHYKWLFPSPLNESHRSLPWRGRSKFTLAPPAGMQENYEVERVKDFPLLNREDGMANRSNQLFHYDHSLHCRTAITTQGSGHPSSSLAASFQKVQSVVEDTFLRVGETTAPRLFWVLTPRSLISKYRYFGQMYCLHLQGPYKHW
jgi:hypothetical protein